MTIEAARQLASKAHAGQTRKYNHQPYISHPMRVAGLVTDSPNLENRDLMIRAAWCHDVIEDCPQVTYREIEDAIGLDGFNLVRELTNTSKGFLVPRADRKFIDRERISKCSREAKIIKLMDRYDNLTELSLDMDASQEARLFAPVYARESEQLLYVIHDASDQWATQLLMAIGRIYLKLSGTF